MASSALRACIARRATTGVLNAFVDLAPAAEAAGTAATSSPNTVAATGELADFPISVKANLCVQGKPATAGSRMLCNYVAPYSSTAVERACAQHGAPLVGITAMDEFGMGSATTHCYRQAADGVSGPQTGAASSSAGKHEPAFNPYSADWAIRYAMTQQRQQQQQQANTSTASSSSSASSASPAAPPTHPRTRSGGQQHTVRGWLTPGGSSGGSAVSVAVGSSRGSFGSDTGGSIRQPASFCGVVGLKPSYGRIPRHGLIAYASSLDTVGVLTRSVRDAAVLYATAAGHNPRDDTSMRQPSAVASGSGGSSALSEAAAALLEPPAVWSADSNAAVRHSSSKPLEGLRVGIPREYYVSELTPPVLSAWRRGADLLAAAGATLLPVSLPHTAAALHAYYIIAPAEAASNLARYDGVRYGYRAADVAAAAMAGERHSSSSSSPTAPAAGNAAAALHELYTRSRSAGFGPEVTRRILAGTYASSQSARSEYYDRAMSIQDLVRSDFAAAFRPPPPPAAQAVAASPIAAANAASGCSGDATRGVDVLLVPTAPSLPWLSDHTAQQEPVAVYAQDTLTIPTSLAHLPAVSLPVDLTDYPEPMLRVALDTCTALPAADDSKSSSGRQVRQAVEEAVRQLVKLPVGLQLIGRLGDEHTVLYTAAVLEAAAGFKAPAYVRGE